MKSKYLDLLLQVLYVLVCIGFIAGTTALYIYAGTENDINFWLLLLSA